MDKASLHFYESLDDMAEIERLYYNAVDEARDLRGRADMLERQAKMYARWFKLKKGAPIAKD